MSPEYAMEGRFSEKSDVFSFGVLLLEIVSGRKNTSFYHNDQFLNLLGLVSNLIASFLKSSTVFCSSLYFGIHGNHFNLTFIFPGMAIVECRQHYSINRPNGI